MNNTQALGAFLDKIGPRALVIARLSCGNPDDAAELVQESMLRHVQHYAEHDQAQWPALFHRILQNQLRDHARKQSLRRWRMVLFGDRPQYHDEQDSADPSLDVACSELQPQQRLAQDDHANALDAAISALPARQRQAFLLRTWEGLDVASTATAMGVSAGSVKTHLSRALASLREALGEHYAT